MFQIYLCRSRIFEQYCLHLASPEQHPFAVACHFRKTHMGVCTSHIRGALPNTRMFVNPSQVLSLSLLESEQVGINLRALLLDFFFARLRAEYLRALACVTLYRGTQRAFRRPAQLLKTQQNVSRFRHQASSRPVRAPTPRQAYTLTPPTHAIRSRERSIHTRAAHNQPYSEGGNTSMSRSENPSVLGKCE